MAKRKTKPEEMPSADDLWADLQQLLRLVFLRSKGEISDQDAKVSLEKIHQEIRRILKRESKPFYQAFNKLPVAGLAQVYERVRHAGHLPEAEYRRAIAQVFGGKGLDENTEDCLDPKDLPSYLLLTSAKIAELRGPVEAAYFCVGKYYGISRSHIRAQPDLMVAFRAEPQWKWAKRDKTEFYTTVLERVFSCEAEVAQSLAMILGAQHKLSFSRDT